MLSLVCGHDSLAAVVDNDKSVIAHTEAYDRAQVLHRDVSAGNIMITEEGSGRLIDWDLSKKVVKDGVKARQHSRTVRRLENCSMHMIGCRITPGNVLLYRIAKCRGPEKADMSQQMKVVFDQYYDMG